MIFAAVILDVSPREAFVRVQIDATDEAARFVTDAFRQALDASSWCHLVFGTTPTLRIAPPTWTSVDPGDRARWVRTKAEDVARVVRALRASLQSFERHCVALLAGRPS